MTRSAPAASALSNRSGRVAGTNKYETGAGLDIQMAFDVLSSVMACDE